MADGTDLKARDLLYLGTHGHALALRKDTGETVWKQSLPNTGYGLVSILYEEGRLFCGVGGRVFCLDPLTGEIQWENALKDMGMQAVYLTSGLSNDTEALMSMLESQKSRQQI